MVNIWNRSGDTGSGQGASDFFKQSRSALGKDFKVNCVLCDSGFCLIEFIEYLESEHYSYIIAAPVSRSIQREILGVRNWKKISEGIEVGKFEFEHMDLKWTHPRRYVVVRQTINKNPKAAGKQPSLFKNLEAWSKYRISVMITNDLHSSPEKIWREYRPRTNDENVIKDLKGPGFEKHYYN